MVLNVPHIAYHAPPRNPQQHQNRNGGYQQGYPPPNQTVSHPRYGPPPVHAMSQQNSRAHHHHNLHVAPNNYRQAGAPNHYHPQPHVALPGVPHGMVHPPHQHHIHHQYQSRVFVMPPHQQSHNHHHHHQQYAVGNKAIVGESAREILPANPVGNATAPTTNKVGKYDGTTSSNLSENPETSQSGDTSSQGGNAFDTGVNKEKEGYQAGEDTIHSIGKIPSEGFVLALSPKVETTNFSGSETDLSCIERKNSTKKSTSIPSGNAMTVMSPITMCFDRMLGAAEAIKTPSATSKLNCQKKRGPLSKKILPLNTSNNIRSKRTSVDAEINPFDELLEDPDLERLVILQMAMQRNQHFQTIGGTSNNDVQKLDSLPPLPQPPKRDVSRVITEGFFWREYPACEQILYNHMHKYYEISAIQKNYKIQQYFNNVLVDEVRKAAEDSGFTVDPDFCDKKLRDRIRCFYKTHLQNAKKRLATLQKHADSFENQCLVAVFIRCVRNPDLTFEDSLAMANTTTDFDQENVVVPTVNSTAVPFKNRSLDKVESFQVSKNSNTLSENCKSSDDNSTN